MPILKELISYQQNLTSQSKSSRLVCNKTLVGIEIELEQLRLGSLALVGIKPKSFWNFVEEHSIRLGGEMVLSSPLNGLLLLEALDEYTLFLKRFKKKFKVLPVISERCSLHVHVDVRSMEVDKINNFIMLYLIMEKILFQLVGIHRISNNYCTALSYTDFNSILSNIPKPTIDTSGDYIQYLDSRFNKYGSLNISSIIKFGSLEFRGHPGSFYSSDILDWVNILLCMKVYVEESDELTSILGIKDITPELFITKIFKDHASILLNTDNLHANFNHGRSWALQVLSRDILRKDTIKWLKTRDNSDELLIDKFKEAN